jgi:hypothetical protein
MRRLLLLCCCAGNALVAQISMATLGGTVKDASGAVIPNAGVEVRNLGTNLTRSVRTDAAGEYVIPDLAVAHYELKVTLAGFKTYVQPDIELQLAQRATADVVLEVGSAEQEVTVSAAAVPLLNAATSSVG